MAEQVNLVLKKADSWSRIIYFEDEDGADLDITGWKIYFMVKEKITDDDVNAVISKEITSHSAPTAGESKIELSSTDTDHSGNYIFAIKVITDDEIGGIAEAITVMEGTIAFTDTIIQAVS